MNAQKHILMVTTSADALVNGRKTGVWLEEIAVPYLALARAGLAITLASPKGGAVPIDLSQRPGEWHASDRCGFGQAQACDETRRLRVVLERSFVQEKALLPAPNRHSAP